MLHHLPRPAPLAPFPALHRPPRRPHPDPRFLRRPPSPAVDLRPPPSPPSRHHDLRDTFPLPPSSATDHHPRSPSPHYDNGAPLDPSAAEAASSLADMYSAQADLLSNYPAPPTASSSSAGSNPAQDLDNDDPYALPRRSPPPILTGDLPQSDPEHAGYSPSPLSASPNIGGRDGPGAFPFTTSPLPSQYASYAVTQPQSLPSSARYPHSQNNPILDRRMSEPVLSQRFAQGQLPPPQSPSHAQVASQPQYTYAPSALSPRPASATYAYPPYGPTSHGHARVNSGSSGSLTDSYGAAPASWPGPLQHDLEGQVPVSPVYEGSVSDSDGGGVAGSPPLSSSRLGQQQQTRLGAPQGQGQQLPAQAGGQPGGQGQGLQAPGVGGPQQRSANGKTYSFVSLPGNAVKKRPRRRYDEIERLYQCSWPNCTKAYGTLNHLNAHVTMQKHGPKRSPGEFKELRKQWRQAKKEQEESERQAQAEREAHAQAMQGVPPLGVSAAGGVAMGGMSAIPSMLHMRSPLGHPSHHAHAHHQHPNPYVYQPRELEHHRGTVHRRMSIAEPYPDPHAHHAMGGGHGYMHSQPHGYGSPSGYPMSAPAHAVDSGARYALTSPADDAPHGVRYGQQHAHEQEETLQDLAQQYRQQGYAAPPQGGWQQSQSQGHGHHELRHHASQPHLGGMSAPGASANAQSRPVHPYYTVHPNASPTLGAPQGHPGMVLPPLSAPSSSYASLGSSSSNSAPADLPALAAHVSLGRNQLPPDSTLLTPLPGYEPDPDVAGLMGAQQRYAQPEHEHDRYTRAADSGEGYFD